MSRYGTFPERKNSDGQALCKWCGDPVPKGRRCFCSGGCAFEVQIRRDAGFLRARVKERDHGVCAGCGIDTMQLKRILHFTRRSFAVYCGVDPMFANEFWFHRIMAVWYGEYIWQTVREKCRWEADHIVEVVRGGDPYLNNVQTLCVSCHKAKSKRQHKERAAERRTPLFNAPARLVETETTR